MDPIRNNLKSINGGELHASTEDLTRMVAAGLLVAHVHIPGMRKRPVVTYTLAEGVSGIDAATAVLPDITLPPAEELLDNDGGRLRLSRSILAEDTVTWEVWSVPAGTFYIFPAASAVEAIAIARKFVATGRRTA